MKRRTMIATTAIFALTAAMLFAGVVNAQQPATATEQYRGCPGMGGCPCMGGHPGMGGCPGMGGHPGMGGCPGMGAATTGGNTLDA